MYNSEQVIKIWLHESERVFGDRLLENDIPTFNNLITDILKKSYAQSYKSISNNGFLVFGN